MIYQTLTLVAVLSAVSAYTPPDDVQQKYMWESFKREHQKSYSTMEEELSRFSHFVSNLRMHDQRNINERLAGGSATHGITKFSDMSQEEFALTFLTADPSLKTKDAVVAQISEPPNASLGLVDWTGKLTTPIKDQGYCGSCWAFSAMEQIESDSMRTLGTSYLLSAQQITSCAGFPDQGCNGGWTEYAYKYVTKAGGIVTEANYPYTSYNGATGTCQLNSAQEVISVSGYTTIQGESAMATYVQTTGPLSVCLDANLFNSYVGGILTSCGTSVDHCVQAVGVDVTAGYWKVRNQWGLNWGESGFIRIAYGKNTCAITNDPTYVTVSKK